jgi:hypothetical protein
MTVGSKFDIDITLSDSALGWATHPIHASHPINALSLPGEPGERDEFDLDIKYTEPLVISENGFGAGNGGEWVAGIFSITCGNTCEVIATCGHTCQVIATCGHTCQVIATCGNTCGITCGHTCQIAATCTCTCGHTCGVTCGNTCGVTCGNTCGVTCGHTCQILQTCPCLATANGFTCVGCGPNTGGCGPGTLGCGPGTVGCGGGTAIGCGAPGHTLVGCPPHLQ